MSLPLFARFRSLLAADGERLAGDPRMKLCHEGRYFLQYMPFEPSSLSAKLVLVGITPGTTQVGIAYGAVKSLLCPPIGTRPLSDAEILSEVKRRAGFGGPMRPNLLRMLRHFKIGRLIGVTDEAELWNGRADTLHSTSIVPHAAFTRNEKLGTKMFAGSFETILQSNLLRGCFERDFVTSLATLPSDALFIALGPTPLDALEWCAGRGFISQRRILGAFPHPSRQAGSQVDVFLGLKDPATLKPKDPTRHRVKWLLGAAERMHSATSCAASPPAFDCLRSENCTPSCSTVALKPRPEAEARSTALSPLGLEIEEALIASRRYSRHYSHAFMCTFRTKGGTVFAFERKSKVAINLWLPPSAAVDAVASSEGIQTSLKPPGGQGEPYGRLHALKSIPELKDQTLLVVPTRSALQALRVLAALP